MNAKRPLRSVPVALARTRMDRCSGQRQPQAEEPRPHEPVAQHRRSIPWWKRESVHRVRRAEERRPMSALTAAPAPDREAEDGVQLGTTVTGEEAWNLINGPYNTVAHPARRVKGRCMRSCAWPVPGPPTGAGYRRSTVWAVTDVEVRS